MTNLKNMKMETKSKQKIWKRYDETSKKIKFNITILIKNKNKSFILIYKCRAIKSNH